jgi:hypothetical protein
VAVFEFFCLIISFLILFENYIFLISFKIVFFCIIVLKNRLLSKDDFHINFFLTFEKTHEKL